MKNATIALLCVIVLLLSGVVIAQRAQKIENLQKSHNELVEAARLLRGYQPSPGAQAHRDAALHDIDDAINHLNESIRLDVAQ